MSPDRRARRVFPAGMALALILAACSGSSESTTPDFTLPPAATSAPTTTTGESSPPSTTAEDRAYRWQAGDCVDLGRDASAQLPYAPYGTNLIVSCDAAHSHEIYFTSTLEGDADAPYPSDLLTTLWDRCYEEFSSLMGFRSSDSTLEPVLYLPDAREWEAGERYHACVVFQMESGNTYAALTGSVTDDLASYRWELDVGSCLDGELAELRGLAPVPCSEPHSFELIGTIEHPGGADQPYPGEAVLAEYGQLECALLLDEYAALPVDPELVGAVFHPLTLANGEWDLGHRTFRCFGYAATAEDGLLNVQGSLAEETWTVLGPREDEDGVTA